MLRPQSSLPFADVFAAAGYRRHERGMSEYAAGLFQRRVRAEEYPSAGLADAYEWFLCFDHFAPDAYSDSDRFTAWCQVESPRGWAVRIETFTHTAEDIVTRLGEIEAEMIALTHRIYEVEAS